MISRAVVMAFSFGNGVCLGLGVGIRSGLVPTAHGRETRPWTSWAGPSRWGRTAKRRSCPQTVSLLTICVQRRFPGNRMSAFSTSIRGIPSFRGVLGGPSSGLVWTWPIAVCKFIFRFRLGVGAGLAGRVQDRQGCRCSRAAAPMHPAKEGQGGRLVSGKVRRLGGPGRRRSRIWLSLPARWQGTCGSSPEPGRYTRRAHGRLWP